MTLPAFIQRAVAFFEKWEANLTASAEQLAAKVTEVAKLTTDLTAANVSLVAAQAEAKTFSEKVAGLEKTNAEQAAEILKLKGEKTTLDEAAGKKANDIIAGQGVPPVAGEVSETPANAGKSGIDQYRELMAAGKVEEAANLYASGKVFQTKK